MNKRSTATVIGVILIIVGFNWSRFSRNAGEPAFSSEPPGVWIQLGEGFPESGLVRQFYDDCVLRSVTKLANIPLALDNQEATANDCSVMSGRRIDLIIQEAEIQSIYFSWMPAGQRIALGIPLHPDRMNLTDWEFLPGVGPAMSTRIEENRQINGDFGSLEGLLRIRGVGPSKIAAWKQYF